MGGCEICGLLAVRCGLVHGFTMELCSPCFEDVGADRVMTAVEAKLCREMLAGRQNVLAMTSTAWVHQGFEHPGA